MNGRRKLVPLYLISVLISACPLFGDPLVYEFSGTVASSVDERSLPRARIIASCEKAKLDSPLEVLSNENGDFVLSGGYWGTLDGCKLKIENQGYRTAIVNLDRNAMGIKGLMRTWKVFVKLDPV
jgi:hypothetical protein